MKAVAEHIEYADWEADMHATVQVCMSMLLSLAKAIMTFDFPFNALGVVLKVAKVPHAAHYQELSLQFDKGSSALHVAGAAGRVNLNKAAKERKNQQSLLTKYSYSDTQLTDFCTRAKL